MAPSGSSTLDRALVSSVGLFGHTITISHLVLTTLIARQAAHIAAKVLYIKNDHKHSRHAALVGSVIDMAFAIAVATRIWKSKGSMTESTFVVLGSITLFVLEILREREL